MLEQTTVILDCMQNNRGLRDPNGQVYFYIDDKMDRLVIDTKFFLSLTSFPDEDRAALREAFRSYGFIDCINMIPGKPQVVRLQTKKIAAPLTYFVPMTLASESPSSEKKSLKAYLTETSAEVEGITDPTIILKQNEYRIHFLTGKDKRTFLPLYATVNELRAIKNARPLKVTLEEAVAVLKRNPKITGVLFDPAHSGLVLSANLLEDMEGLYVTLSFERLETFIDLYSRMRDGFFKQKILTEMNAYALECEHYYCLLDPMCMDEEDEEPVPYIAPATIGGKEHQFVLRLFTRKQFALEFCKMNKAYTVNDVPCVAKVKEGKIGDLFRWAGTFYEDCRLFLNPGVPIFMSDTILNMYKKAGKEFTPYQVPENFSMDEFLTKDLPEV